ncbi:hypothetical protein AVEN_30021-1 [Araneus ventricosus]|uniref:Uncharacterized protein n=1 Tax=Araneus ventricosus TaxID=182803 RepID=A0A4Y2DVI5_ARAVE|nr:hypothetical protein AVEN_30021-1 [Araneus ventricosus]
MGKTPAQRLRVAPPRQFSGCVLLIFFQFLSHSETSFSIPELQHQFLESFSVAFYSRKSNTERRHRSRANRITDHGAWFHSLRRTEALHAGRRPLGQPCVGLCGVLGAAHRPALSDDSAGKRALLLPLSPSANHPLAEEWSGAEDADQRSTHRRLIGNTPLNAPPLLSLCGKERCCSCSYAMLSVCRFALSYPSGGVGERRGG